MEHKNIAFIGAGNMVRSIVAGLVASGYPADKITATAPSETRRVPLEKDYGINTTSNNIDAATQADVVVLSVKPQMMEEACKPLQQVDFSNKLVISIAAGINAARFDEMLDYSLSLVRVMPNTPSLVGKGMSGLFANAKATEDDKTFAAQLMQQSAKSLGLSKSLELTISLLPRVVLQLTSSYLWKRCKQKPSSKALHLKLHAN